MTIVYLLPSPNIVMICEKTESIINLKPSLYFLSAPQDDLPGQALLDVVFARLNLIETAYFGIRYIDQDNQTVSTVANNPGLRFFVRFPLGCHHLSDKAPLTTQAGRTSLLVRNLTNRCNADAINFLSLSRFGFHSTGSILPLDCPGS